MENEQSHEETIELFLTIKEFINTLEESADSEIQISGVLTLFKSIIGYLEAGENVRSSQSEVLHSLNESSQANVKGFIEIYDRIETLEKNVSDLASNSAKLGMEVMKLAETAAKIPVINIDNLLKTLNEHAEEINENTASIKAINGKG